MKGRKDGRTQRKGGGEGRTRKDSKERKEEWKESKKEARTLSLTVITLTVCVCFLIPKSSHHQYDGFFDGGPRYHIDTCYLYPNEVFVFGILKASHVSI